MKTVVISEDMGGRLDEGIRKFATHLADGLATHGDTWGIRTNPPDGRPSSSIVRNLGSDKLFRKGDMPAAVRGLSPDLIVYVPSASGTLFSFVRGRMLKRHVPGAHVSMVLPQRRSHGALSRKVIRRFAPDSLFCQSAATIQYFDALGIPARFLPSGVDTERFRPVREDQLALRRKYALPLSEYLVFHAGHLKPGRNAGLLTRLEGVGKGVMLAGRSMGLDPALKHQMEERGVVVIDQYIERVEEVYQAVDAYLFPVREEDSAMEFPLSLLEAMATDLPVAAYPYGGLPMALQARDGLSFRETDEGLVDALRTLKVTNVATREQAMNLAWESVAEHLLVEIGMRSDAGTVAAAA